MGDGGRSRAVRRAAIALGAACAVASGACSEESEPAADAAVVDAAADDGGGDDAISDACAGIIDVDFYTVDEHECGLAPDGPVYCRYWIRFDAGAYVWHHSDVVSEAEYTCSDGELQGLGGFPVSGTFDPVTGILVWDDLPYEMQPSR